MEGSGDITTTIKDICKIFDLNMNNVLKYKDKMWWARPHPFSDGGKEGATLKQRRWSLIDIHGMRDWFMEENHERWNNLSQHMLGLVVCYAS